MARGDLDIDPIRALERDLGRESLLSRARARFSLGVVAERTRADAAADAPRLNPALEKTRLVHGTPASDVSGRLAESINVRWLSDLEVDVGSSLFYAHFAHDGTATQAPDPFLERASERHVDEFDRMWEPEV